MDYDTAISPIQIPAIKTMATPLFDWGKWQSWL